MRARWTLAAPAARMPANADGGDVSIEDAGENAMRKEERRWNK